MEKYEKYERYELHLTDRDELVREKVRLQKEGWVFDVEDHYDLADRTRVYRLKGVKYKKKEQKKEKPFILTKEVDGFGLRQFVREAIIPELIEAVRDRELMVSLGDVLSIEFK